MVKLSTGYRKLICLLLACLAIQLHAQSIASENVPVELHSEAGQNWLNQTEVKQDLYQLQRYFVPQINGAFCGLASMAMVLNSLQKSDLENPFYTQRSILSSDTDAIIPAQRVATQGLTLEELEAILRRHGATASRYHGEDLTLEQFRSLVVDSLAKEEQYVLINYLRRSIGQTGNGHISPVVAYYPHSDQLLILDVAENRYPPVWVDAKTLWRAASTLDAVSGKTRGVIVVSGNE